VGNLMLHCSACHRAHHTGRLQIAGTAPDHIETQRRSDEPDPRQVVRVENADASMQEQARLALVGLGWPSPTARNAVAAAASHVGREATIDVWIREALRRCPVRKAG